MDATFGDLLRDNPLAVSKTRAAQLLGVTRATVYKMVADGRIRKAADNKIVTRSIAEYLTMEKGENNPYSRA